MRWVGALEHYRIQILTESLRASWGVFSVTKCVNAWSRKKCWVVLSTIESGADASSVIVKGRNAEHRVGPILAME